MLGRVLLSLLLFSCATPALSQPREVDVELFLAVDISRSMAPSELAIQRQGYAAALRSPDVVGAITGGLIGSVALTYVEWAGQNGQRVVIPWTVIETREQAETFAARIEAGNRPSLWRTSISAAISFAAHSIETNEIEGLRRVIDISGDGPNNQGEVVTYARDAALGQGITINGLPLMTRAGYFMNVHLEDLDAYYQNCVIGGPGAFTVPVFDWAQFADAVKRKLILEIASTPAQAVVIPAQYLEQTETGYDCRIGEKMWEENRRRRAQP